MKIGKANYGLVKKRFKIMDGDNVFRILPPLGEMASTGKWSQYYRVEWGYQTTSGKKKPFLDPRRVDFKTKEVLVESETFLRRDKIAKAKDLVLNQLKTNPNNPTLLKKKEELIDLAKRYNVEAKYYVNAVNLQGEIGLLKIGKDAMDQLHTQIKILRDRGFDPIGLNGVFFNFFRSGTGFQTSYNVSPYRELQADGSEKIKIQSMDNDFIARLSSEAFELKGMFPEITAEQAARLVNEGDSAVDEILGGNDGEGRSAEDVVGEVYEEEDLTSLSHAPVAKAAPVAAPQPTKAPAPVAKPAPAHAADVNLEDVLTTKAPVKEAAKTGNDFGNMSQEEVEFLKSLGV